MPTQHTIICTYQNQHVFKKKITICKKEFVKRKAKKILYLTVHIRDPMTRDLRVNLEA